MKLRAMVVLVVGVLALAGCVPAAPSTQPSPTATSTSAVPASPAHVIDVIELNGHGTLAGETIDVPIGDDARSAQVRFACAGEGFFSIEFGEAVQGMPPFLDAPCSRGEVSTVVPVAPGNGDLRLTTTDGALWIAQVTLSSDPFVVDEALAADCAAYSEAMSILHNADMGLTEYRAFDEAEWRTRVADGHAALVAARDGSTSRLAPVFAELVAAAEGADPVPGEAQDPLRADGGVVSATCAAQHTVVAITAEFGG